ncbi:Late embryogenesis abundant protein, LEA-14 [Spatholobus suberectus]|nr:Late embryogenesis abundant protein, LEA-14 [Spatholobus suberectus]
MPSSSIFINCNHITHTQCLKRETMRISKASFYAVLLRKPHHHQNHVVLSRRFVVTCALGLLLLASTLYIFWPSDPDLKIVGLKLRRIKVHPVPPITVDISMILTLRVHNADVYSMDFGAINVAVAYRGKMLGHVSSRHVHVRARGSSYVDADVDFAGISVLPELVLLLEDLAKGIVPFDTVSQTRGQLGLFFFHFPMKVTNLILLSPSLIICFFYFFIFRKKSLIDNNKTQAGNHKR